MEIQHIKNGKNVVLSKKNATKNLSPRHFRRLNKKKYVNLMGQNLLH